jgi:hypothetical protein
MHPFELCLENIEVSTIICCCVDIKQRLPATQNAAALVWGGDTNTTWPPLVLFKPGSQPSYFNLPDLGLYIPNRHLHPTEVAQWECNSKTSEKNRGSRSESCTKLGRHNAAVEISQSPYIEITLPYCREMSEGNFLEILSAVRGGTPITQKTWCYFWNTITA